MSQSPTPIVMVARAGTIRNPVFTVEMWVANHFPAVTTTHADGTTEVVHEPYIQLPQHPETMGYDYDGYLWRSLVVTITYSQDDDGGFTGDTVEPRVAYQSLAHQVDWDIDLDYAQRMQDTLMRVRRVMDREVAVNGPFRPNDAATRMAQVLARAAHAPTDRFRWVGPEARMLIDAEEMDGSDLSVRVTDAALGLRR